MLLCLKGMRFLFFLLLTVSFASCAQHSQNIPKTKSDSSVLDTAYFAAGCFWCVEAIFESIEGVEEVISGYTGGQTANPTYKEVCSGTTGHAEAIMIVYNKKSVPYDTLLSAFFSSHDPSTLNQQGPDVGTQYRSAIFYSTSAEKQLIEKCISQLLEKKVFNEITTEVSPFVKFWEAEIYHQDFEANNPYNFYIQNVSIPRFEKFKQKFKGKLK